MNSRDQAKERIIESALAEATSDRRPPDLTESILEEAARRGYEDFERPLLAQEQEASFSTASKGKLLLAAASLLTLIALGTIALIELREHKENKGRFDGPPHSTSLGSIDWHEEDDDRLQQPPAVTDLVAPDSITEPDEASEWSVAIDDYKIKFVNENKERFVWDSQSELTPAPFASELAPPPTLRYSAPRFEPPVLEPLLYCKPEEAAPSSFSPALNSTLLITDTSKEDSGLPDIKSLLYRVDGPILQRDVGTDAHPIRPMWSTHSQRTDLFGHHNFLGIGLDRIQPWPAPLYSYPQLVLHDPYSAFIDLDKNFDGLVDNLELPLQELFTRYDVNLDGKLGYGEFASAGDFPQWQWYDYHNSYTPWSSQSFSPFIDQTPKVLRPEDMIIKPSPAKHIIRIIEPSTPIKDPSKAEIEKIAAELEAAIKKAQAKLKAIKEGKSPSAPIVMKPAKTKEQVAKERAERLEKRKREQAAAKVRDAELKIAKVKEYEAIRQAKEARKKAIKEINAKYLLAIAEK